MVSDGEQSIGMAPQGNFAVTFDLWPFDLKI